MPIESSQLLFNKFDSRIHDVLVYIENNLCLYVVRSYNEYRSQVSNNPDMKLVHLSDSIKGLKLDIRYATENNFTKQKVYTSADPFLRIPAMRALRKVQDSLSKHNIGLIVFDAYRPYSATVKFYEVVKLERKVTLLNIV